MAERIVPIITAKGRELVRQHQAQGALTAIVTAANSFVTAPIAQELGITHLIATEPAHADGEFTGGIVGIPSFREGKITRVETWLADLGHDWEHFGRSWFYSDSLNDLPLLGKVTDPVAVDPDPTLADHAREQGWPIISLR
jgi:HAD superfamily hydrolase (TIGR01490 family)